jgi:hypothetical protein
MSVTLPQTVAAQPQRRLSCRLCWAPIGQCCTVSGPPGDHLARYMEAQEAGLISRDDLAAVITEPIVIAPHVVIGERRRVR